jgi:uncharacterized membrane protein
MNKIWNLALKGLITVLPVGITIYLVYWLGTTAESLFGSVIKLVLPHEYYWPGLGLVSGFTLLILAGILVNAWLVKRIIGVGEYLLNQIPLVKSIYSSVKDFLSYFSTAMDKKKLESVVLVDFDGFHLLGFVTKDDTSGLPFSQHFSDKDNIVLVYFPMSYQVGGYTLYIAKERLKTVEMSIENAMRLALTAGLSGVQKDDAKPAR